MPKDTPAQKRKARTQTPQDMGAESCRRISLAENIISAILEMDADHSSTETILTGGDEPLGSDPKRSKSKKSQGYQTNTQGRQDRPLKLAKSKIF